MPYLEINPRYQQLLHRLGLQAPEDFLYLPAVIISGHPDRNVSTVVLDGEGSTVHAFLKREHCIRWKDRVLNALAGFGFVSKSRRECLMLQALAQASISCPEWIAVGEDAQGRAFLLLRELAAASDVRVHLRDRLSAHPRARRRFALRLGTALARLHNAGFDHPDLYSKHIMVSHVGTDIHFVDLQRSRRRGSVPWRQRWSDLAALEATLTEGLLPTTDRMVCLRAYLRSCRVRGAVHGTNLLHSAYQVFRKAAHLVSHRRIQEMRNGPRSEIVQRLIWLNGEALCVTPEFQALLNCKLPDELVLANLPSRPRAHEWRQNLALRHGRQANLVRQRSKNILAGIWSTISRRRLRSRELQYAAIIYRLQRAGIHTPNLLAFGQRQLRPWRMESFLLTEIPKSVSLHRWFAVNGLFVDNRCAACERRRLIEETARFLKRLHEAQCYLGSAANVDVIQVYPGPPLVAGRLAAYERSEQAYIVLQTVEGVLVRHHANRKLVAKDLKIVHSHLRAFLSRTDVLRFLRSYFGQERMKSAARRLARSFVRASGWQTALPRGSFPAAPPASRPLSRRSAAA